MPHKKIRITRNYLGSGLLLMAMPFSSLKTMTSLDFVKYLILSALASGASGLHSFRNSILSRESRICKGLTN